MPEAGETPAYLCFRIAVADHPVSASRQLGSTTALRTATDSDDVRPRPIWAVTYGEHIRHGCDRFGIRETAVRARDSFPHCWVTPEAWRFPCGPPSRRIGCCGGRLRLRLSPHDHCRRLDCDRAADTASVPVEQRLRHRQCRRSRRPARIASGLCRIAEPGGKFPRVRCAESLKALASGQRDWTTGHGRGAKGGAAGNRTRVLRHSLKTSPCAVRYVSARISWSREPARMTIPVAVGVPMSPATELIGGSL